MTSARLRRGDVPGVLVLTGLLLGSVFSAVSPGTVETIGPLILIVGHITAATLLVGRTRGTPDAKAWLALAAALYCGAGGVVVLGIMVSLGVPTPAFGPVDLVFLSGYVGLMVGLFLLIRRGTGGASWFVTMLDTAVAAVAVAVFVWVGIGQRLIGTLEKADVWSRVIAPMYPIIDVALVVGLIALGLRRARFHFDPMLLLLGAGLGIQVVADAFFFASGVGENFSMLIPRFDLFLLASACYVAVGILAGRPRREREFAERSVSWLPLVWPYLLGSGLIAMHIVGLFGLDLPQDELVALLGSIAVGGLVVVRQAAAIAAAHRRVEDQRQELISSISHEVRTPLTGLVGYMELLATARAQFPADEVDEMMNVASQEASQLGRIITDLIAMARDDGKSLQISVGATKLTTIVRLAVKRSPGVSADVAVDDDAEVEVDQDRLAQAVANLLSNALRYGRETIKVVGRTDSGTLTLEVHDDGQGVPVRYRERIWEKFERGAHKLSAVHSGVGMGLTLVRAIAQAHGGTATYRQSELLGGACFVVTVPLGKQTTLRSLTAAIRATISV